MVSATVGNVPGRFRGRLGRPGRTAGSDGRVARPALKSQICHLKSPSPFLGLLCRAVLVYSLGVWRTSRLWYGVCTRVLFRVGKMAVLGGGSAVPCTCNPLQQG